MKQAEEIWTNIEKDVQGIITKEPFLYSFLTMTILKHNTIYEALSYYLSEKLQNSFLSNSELQIIFLEAMEDSEDIRKSIIDDLRAIEQRDPASKDFLNPFLNYKGYHALESYRVTHWLWQNDRKELAYLIQSLISLKYGVDIHPGAKIGKGILIDHATSVVIGETAVVGDNVSMLHEVTLGGTGKETGDRHPKIGQGVLIGAGAKILGNIKIGDGVKIGAGSVVLSDVEPHTTVVGIPAQQVGNPRCDSPAFEMDQML